MKKSIKKPQDLTLRFFVPRTGIEPAHPCERQILSLLRLPIPPSGRVNYQLSITNYELRITNYELRITNYELRIHNSFSGGNITHSILSVQKIKS